MRENKRLLQNIADNPFHPLYNLGEKTYSLVSEGSFLNQRQGRLKEKKLSNESLPLLFEIGQDDLDILIGGSGNGFTINKNRLKRVDVPEDLITSLLVSMSTKEQVDPWWVDSVISEIEDDLDLELLMSSQKQYREILYEASPALKIYLPYHWAELALLATTVQGDDMVFVEKVNLDNQVNGEVAQILNSEYKDFLEIQDDKRLSNIHKEYIMKHLITADLEKSLQFGMPFPFDTRGKKIERVNIKVIDSSNQER